MMNRFFSIFVCLSFLFVGCSGGGGGGGAGENGPAQNTAVDANDLNATSGVQQNLIQDDNVTISLVKVEITPAAETIPAGLSIQYTATGIYSDDSKKDLTNDVLWRFSNDAVATFSQDSSDKGFLKALSVGFGEITAVIGSVSGSTSISVTDAELRELDISSSFQSLPAGLPGKLVATGLYSDNSIRDVTENVTWEVLNASIATIENSAHKGTLTGLSAGTADVSAQLDGLVATLSIDVVEAMLMKIEVTADTASTSLGTSIQFKATGIYSDNMATDITGEVVWTSSAPSVAAPDSSSVYSGKYATYSEGNFTATAAYAGVEGSINAKVTSATLTNLFISPSTISIPNGLSQQLTVTGIFTDSTVKNLTQDVLWEMSDSAVATVSMVAGNEGSLEAFSEGVATVTAKYMGKDASAEVNVTAAIVESIDISPPDLSISAGTSTQLNASGTFSNGMIKDITSDVMWTTSVKDIVSISNGDGNKGLLFAISSGNAQISAYFGGVSAVEDVSVSEAVLQSIEITPDDIEVATGRSIQFTATGHFSDGSTQDMTNSVVWSTANTDIALITNLSIAKGMLHTFSPGETVVTAVFDDFSAETTITVSGESLVALRFSPYAITLETGSTLQLSLEGVYSDGSVQVLNSEAIWLTSNADIALVSNAEGERGLMTGAQPGGCLVAAILGNIALVHPVTILKPLNTIEIVSDTLAIPEDTGIAFSANAYYDDGTEEDVTNIVFWQSSDTQTVVINRYGMAVGLNEGQAEISVSVGGTRYDNQILTVTALVDIAVNAEQISATEIQFTAYGIYSDNRVYNLTGYVNWSSDDPSVVSISNDPETMGLGTVHQSGFALVTATYDNEISGTLNVTVE